MGAGIHRCCARVTSVTKTQLYRVQPRAFSRDAVLAMFRTRRIRAGWGEIEMKRFLLASACLLALTATTPALASAITIDGSFVHLDGSGASVDGYDFNGAVNLPFHWSQFSVEGNVGYEGIAFGHVLDVGGSLVWTEPEWRLAASGIFNQAAGGLNESTYGVGGEWYPLDWLTVSAQGGGITGDISGSYVGGTIKGYVMPDLSAQGFITYTSLSLIHETDYGAKGEWLPWEDCPLAVHAEYERSEISGFGSVGFNLFMVGLTLHLDSGSAPLTLVQHDRTGTLDTIGPIHPLIFGF
jgi:hypothetical protein